MKTKLFLETPQHRTKGEITVILTSYGRDITLQKAIKSILGQTFKEFILIIIDDNSPEINDKTQNIIKSFDDRRIIYFRTEITPMQRKSYSSFCKNINNMLRFARRNLETKYICYLPCDDFFYPNKLQETTAWLNNKGLFSCWHYIDLINKNGSKIGRVPCGAPSNYITNPVAILDHSCVVHHIGLIDKMKYPYWPLDKYSEHQAPDGVFFRELIKVGGGFYKIGTNQSLGAKMRHGDSIQGRVLGWK